MTEVSKYYGKPPKQYQHFLPLPKSSRIKKIPEVLLQKLKYRKHDIS